MQERWYRKHIKLMHDLHCKNANEMYSNVLAQRVSELKETEEGINSMCKELECIYAEIFDEKIDILKEWLVEED